MKKSLIGWTFRNWDIERLGILRTNKAFKRNPSKEKIEIDKVFIKKADAISFWHCDSLEVKKVCITVEEK